MIEYIHICIMFVMHDKLMCQLTMKKTKQI